MLCKPLSALLFALILPLSTAVDHGYVGNMQRERLARHAEMHARRFSGMSQERADTSNFRFLTAQTKKFRVESLPDVSYDVGEMYSGLIPVANNASRSLVYVFQPTVGAPKDEITIWLNGGPGCSSLEGFLQENGLFRWEYGVYRPILNPYSWVNLTNMLWIEQPIGTGFSIGTPTARNEEDVADDFVSWFLNFQKVFGIKNFKIYVTGESYAGRYVPYISSAMIDKNDTTHFDLKGALMYDPCIGDCGLRQVQTVGYPFIEANSDLLNLNITYMQKLASYHQTCGFADYMNKYLTFPPPGNQPTNDYSQFSDDCFIINNAGNAALAVNPCWNPYELNAMCPLAWDVLGFPTALEYTPPGWTNYFDQPAVKQAMHAPMDVTWQECSNVNVFPHGDASPDPNISVLPKVIEYTNRVLVANGDYDMVVLTNGTLLAIQNMTWGGKLGFQRKPERHINIRLPELEYSSVLKNNGVPPSPQGFMGIQHHERGLMFAKTFQSGHMQPQFQSRASYRHLQWLLGQIEVL